MIASLMKSNFEVYDITMSDLIAKTITLDQFKGVVFPGGFSYAGKILKRFNINIQYSHLRFNMNLFNQILWDRRKDGPAVSCSIVIYLPSLMISLAFGKTLFL